MPGRRALITGLVVATVSATALVAPPSGAGAGSPSTATSAPPLAWLDCGDGFQCSTLTVPLDHSKPRGKTIDLALVRRPADDQANRIGALVTNPGGPGASGIEDLRSSAAQYPPELRARFDLVSFDPRGVKASAAMACVDDATLLAHASLDPTPDTPEERAALEGAAEELATACEAKYGKGLRHFSTTATARDLDLIREAIGDQKLTYFGASYGTYLGTQYAELFPKRVRALLLDGGVDPTKSGDESLIEQGVGYERAFQAFLADCAARPDCAFAPGGDPVAAFDELLARVEAAPLATDAGALGPAELLGFVNVFLGGGEAAWPSLARALFLADNGVGTGIVETMRSLADFVKNDSFVAIGCLGPFGVEPGVTDRLDEIESDAGERAPHFGVPRVQGVRECAAWPVRSDPPKALRARGAPPILVIGTIDDPATPVAWSEALADQLRSGVLVTAPGYGHTSFAQGRQSGPGLEFPAKQCVDDIGVRYLVDLEVPENATAC
jgi:pimeloyl-ACP methyl ester carboxylesterase